jgi:hypothetical protein
VTLLQRILLYVCAVLLLVPPAIAQVNDASLTGIVADQSQAAVANATVTARNEATNFTQVVQTDSSGYYSFLSLPIGSYVVTVQQISSPSLRRFFSRLRRRLGTTSR